MRESSHNSFQQGALEQYEDAVTQVILNRTQRYVNVSEMTLTDPETKEPIVIRVTIAAEPLLFSQTTYPPDEAAVATATCEQLKQMERDNGVEL